MKRVKSIADQLRFYWIEPVLENNDFQEGTPRGWFYKRIDEDTLWRVAIGFSTRGRTEAGLLDITLCVGFKSISNFLRLFQPAYVKSVNKPCNMATDLGHATLGEYKEWLISPEIDIARTGREIKGLLEIGVQQYFARYGVMAKALTAWEEGEVFNLGRRSIFYLAAGHAISGRTSHALWLADKFLQEELASTKSTKRDRQEAQDFVEYLRDTVRTDR
jgi:hypothetical protein